MKHRHPSFDLEHWRNIAIHRISEGYTVQEVADFLEVNPSTVRKWIRRFESLGTRGLRSRKHPGRPPKLTRTQEKIILRWIKEPPTDFGFATDLWTGPRLKYLLRNEFGISFHVNYLSTWLRSRNYTPQVPKRSYREENPRRVKYWIEHTWPKIQEKAEEMRAFIVILDESGLLMAPLLRRTWALKGHRPDFPQQGGRREKVSVTAAVVFSPDYELTLFYKTLVDEYFDSFYSALYLEALMKQYNGKNIIVVWDRGPNHKGDPIRQVQRIYKGKLIFKKLPPYAPRVNPVEFVWSWLKYGRLCNYAPKDAEELNRKVVKELEAVKDSGKLLRALWLQSDLPLPEALIF